MRSCTTSRRMPCLLELSTCQKRADEEGDDDQDGLIKRNDDGYDNNDGNE